MTEDEMVGWHHRLWHEFEQALGVGDGHGILDSAVHRVAESDMTEWQNKWPTRYSNFTMINHN